MTGKLVLIRHGESEWNLANRFTGWVDVGLTDKGIQQAKICGQALGRHGFHFDIAYTSVLKRAIHTLWHTLDTLNAVHLPVIKNWVLNERHYGALTGLNKQDVADKYGQEQLKIWRRSYHTPPPELALDSPYHPRHDARYAGINLPSTESLADTVARVVPYWDDVIKPQLLAGKNVLISAHGNSLRGLIKHLSGLSEDAILTLELPNAKAVIYDDIGINAEHRFLDDVL